jgi:thiol:disulfide interchange protein DsbD
MLSPVKLKGYASLSSVPQGGTVNLAVGLRLRGHWHVNANKVNDEYMIPTTVEFEAPAGVTVKAVVYPDAVEKTLSFSQEPLLLYEGEVYVGAIVEVSPDVKPGPITVNAAVTYQACDNEKCLAPETERVPIAIRVSSPEQAIDFAHADVFGEIDFGAAALDSDSGAGGSNLGDIVASRGYFWAFALVFVWGLGLCLTPCVYPMIPITVSYFGGQSAGKTSRTLFLAAIYVLGIAAMYSALGLVAALTGSLFGEALQNPLVLIFVALVFVALSLSMFGLYEFRVPAKLSNFAGQSAGKQGPVGAFLTGLTLGIVAAPCVGPVVIPLLTFVGTSANPVLGFSLFFTLALGLGAPFLVLALISGSISKLPKSGEWMEWIKKFFGVILVAMAIFFVRPLISDVLWYGLIALVLVIGGIWLGFVNKTVTSSVFFMSFKRFAGVALPILGLYLALSPGHILFRGDPGGISWNEFDRALLTEAKQEQQYVLIDFAADWCLPCKELDHKTFSPQEVVDATSGFVTLKADLTQSGSKQVADLRKEFEIKGVPTVVFVDKRGKERKDLRIFGFVNKDEFLDRIGRLKSGT